jgi:ribonuclease HI
VADHRDPLPAESLSPLVARVDRVLARHGYDLLAAAAAIDAVVPGGGLFDPSTSAAELTAATEACLAADGRPPRPSLAFDDGTAVLYTDGSSRGNPGPAGAGAVVCDADSDPVVRLGRPVGSHAGNNTAEYVALHLGLAELLARADPPLAVVEVRIDSRAVIDDVGGDRDAPIDGVERYRRPIGALLAEVPTHRYRHVESTDPNPADALATVGADLAALGPGT